MKKLYLILCHGLFFGTLSAQYFFTGEVRDFHGDRLQNALIQVLSTGAMYTTGSYGEFSIISRRADDSLILTVDGYAPYTTAVSADVYLQVTLKKPLLSEDSFKSPLKCVYRGIEGERPFIQTGGSVAFCGNMGRASYDIVQRFLDMGRVVPSEAVKIEELLNEFDFHYEEPEHREPFHCASTLLSCPWNGSHQLLCLDICAKRMDLFNVPPANLVLLVDVSGSMEPPDKLPIIKSGMRLLIDNLRDNDNVSLISFGKRVSMPLENIPGSEKGKIERAIQVLTADGAIPGEEAIGLAYEEARKQFIDGGNNRIVLITDGDICSDAPHEEDLEQFVGEQARAGIHLDCIGVGTGDFNQSRLPDLARLGQGAFAWAGDEQESERLLAGQLTTHSLDVADGVSITADFDTTLVKGYCLIGYDNKKGVLEDTAMRLDGVKVCSGHSQFAFFELIPKVDSLGRDTIATVRINYRPPGQQAVKTMRYDCPNELIPFDRAGMELKKSICVAMLGLKLRESGYGVRISWDNISRMTKRFFSGSGFLDKEYITLVSKAERIYSKTP